jgi:branched-chain amino acid transport system substrate-binding protein
MKLSNRLLTVSILSVLLGAQVVQAADVPVAVIAPLSGPWARGGESTRQGAELAIEDINASGGIKTLGGAKMKLHVADAGDSPDKARNAAQRLIAEVPGLVGGTGAWLSSFTLAVTEVTERAEIPWLTISFSDQITSRGFKYVFQTSAGGRRQAELALPTIMALAEKASGGKPQSVGVLTDNTPSPQSILAPLRAGGFEKAGLKVLVDETFTPPLSDATSLVQKVRAGRPEMLLALPTGIQDVKLIVEKLNEFGLGQGKLPVIASGAQAASPDLLNLLNADKVNGLMTLLVGWPSKHDTDLEARFKVKYKEAWMTQDAIYSYGDMWLLKEAVERAGAADSKKVAQVLRSIDLKDGAAKYYSGGRVRFDEAGRRIDAGIVIVQWQNGVPKTIFPAETAAVPAIWPKK